MNTKYYVIGAFSDGKKAQVYFDSLAVLGDAVEPIIIQYLRKGTFDKINKPANVKLIKYAKEYPGNTGKHKDFRELIAPLLERETWCLFTDMHDVVFQAPFPVFPETDILIASEAKKFGDVHYWKEIFPPDVWDMDVYNVGCFAMQTQVLKDFWEYLYDNWMEFHQWYKSRSVSRIGNGDSFPFNFPFHEKVRVEMAIMFNGHYDTLSFNRFIRKHKRTELPGLFACYAYQVEMGVVTAKAGRLYQDGNLTTVAHYNGAMKKFMRKEDK